MKDLDFENCGKAGTEQMKEKKEKLIIDGNEIYEIDMDCVKNRQARAGREDRRRQASKEQKKRRGT